MIQRMLLATDGSAPAERAAAAAASLARRYGARLIVVHAYLRVPSYDEDSGDDQILYSTLDEALALVRGTAARLRELGVAEVCTDVMAGPADEVILHLAEIYGPDLLVIGARGRSPWLGLTLGSVSLTVTQRATCPVLVVK
jgi:nucleotide-binding universal stress UspA family protein